ncbi:hypothetical protein [Paenibacillus naphthalenovorans]|uniref:hypothetical protein n=1 Tax=Paenibacillus naphthalenovorans TaxID=162209 RepID=UPI000784F523|nr:hypothetical protein [Paenibacillus naphthalenovorans]
MAKQQSSLKYIFKIHSSRLRKSKWNLNLTIQQAIENEEIVSLADSSVLRFIREINNKNNNTYNDIEKKIKEIKNEIKQIKKKEINSENKKKIKKLYDDLYNLLFVKDYVCIVIDRIQDYDRMNSKKGFYINGVKFKRLLATTGGAKNSTVVFVSANVYEELQERIENGRNKNKMLVPAKFEAYKSLACSASIPVSNPKGVLVVKDCETTFKANVIKIDDTKSQYPIITEEKDYLLSLVDSDGYGLILPSLSEKWSKELGEDYIASGFCIRNSFCKGMLFTFDFLDFAKNIAKNNIVIDAWGNQKDITQVEVVLTTSMLKLWDSYNSIEHYLECCEKNGYTFSVTKITPKELENERNLNYQFIQSLDLSDVQIDKLIDPTVEEIKDVLGGDYRKSILFLKGSHVNEDIFNNNESDFVKALMIEKEMIKDPFVKNKIHNMIKKRINEAKVGVLKVRGNFSTISGDPYSLCQSIFDMEVTGLLKSGEFYSKYWNDKNVDKVACFRAPMTCHNNIRILRLKNTDEMKYWYKYMDTCTIFNSWDTTSHALNGADRDGDTVLTTDNQIILNAIEELDAIICVQKTAEKKIPEEADLIQSNKDSFGDEIGSTTNRITSMFDVRANFSKDSKEYKELDYRIRCGQNYQQNAIDKTKGIESKPMPKEWYDYHSNKNLPSEVREFNLKILADKKPYFFTYIYPELRRVYRNHVNTYEENCVENFRCTLNELISKSNHNEKEKEFLQSYFRHMPVSISDSVMNKICRKIENVFDRIKDNFKTEDFDFNILKSQKKYSQHRYNQVKNLYEEYLEDTKLFMQKIKKDRVSDEEKQLSRSLFKQKFIAKAHSICNDADELCNIVVDICYKRNTSKQFAWDICGEQIISNLLKRNKNIIHIPVLDENGDVEFGGETFSMKKILIEGEELNESHFK